MTTPPAELYPDVAAKGSPAVAAEHGLTPGDVVAHGTEPLRRAVAASTTPLRDALTASAWHAERCWPITGRGQGIWLLSGRTPEPAEVAKQRGPGVRGNLSAASSGPRRSSSRPGRPSRARHTWWRRSHAFSTTTGFRFSPDVVCLEAAGGR